MGAASACATRRASGAQQGVGGGGRLVPCSSVDRSRSRFRPGRSGGLMRRALPAELEMRADRLDEASEFGRVVHREGARARQVDRDQHPRCGRGVASSPPRDRRDKPLQGCNASRAGRSWLRSRCVASPHSSARASWRQRAERFVHDRRTDRATSARQMPTLLLHAAREFVRVLSFETGESDHGQQVACALLELYARSRFWSSTGTSTFLQDVAPRQQHRRLEDYADVATRAVDRPPRSRTSPEVRRRIPARILRSVLFPQPLGPDDGDELAVADVEAHVLERFDVRALERAVDLVEPRDRDQLRGRRRRGARASRRRPALERRAHFTGQLAAAARIAAASKLLIFS